ncbi:rapamycin-insensitive companion of mTOR-like isoform X1 [Haliotis rufescens]|uniref:rapamycin-insensitive companion of mTOR-like isoform X1 n=2 Tax=Haliotis rufescens TaxID=6454 RepID=UPI00201F0A3D|nr:rapamycin-insensitive companion of mTOR-like isoform X1 [Haliotis rufescens]
MAASMVRPGRNIRSSRFRARRESGSEETVRLDWSKDVSENVKEILRHIVQQNNVSKGKKLGYLNCFVKLIHKYGKEKGLGLKSRDILICLRVGLLHEAKEVRAATLRVFRHLLPIGDILDTALSLHLDYLVARSLDICMDNEIERVHAIKLIRNICQLSPQKLCPSLLYPLIAVANDGASERDRLLRVCLASVCEIAFHNTSVLYKCGGVSSILRNILACHQYPRLNESLVCTVLYLLNHPRTRHYIKANTDLEQLLAPFTDCHFKYSGESEHSHHDSQEARFSASRMALITVIRSWPGLIRLCHPEGSGLQSLIGILYLPFAEIRKSILELIFDLFRLTLPQWTEDFATALVSVDPSEMQDGWRLTEGFVAEEGRTVLPHMAKTRPNLVENHLALILCAWIHAGILEALVEVICSSEGPLFVRGVILVGELLHMANQLLPTECSNHSQCLPTLISMASSFDVPLAKRHQASLAVTYLSHFHAMKKRGAVPCSLYLDQLLQHAGKFVEYIGRHWHLRRDKLAETYFTKYLSEDLLSQAVKDSQVLITKENTNWDWDLICALLKWPDEKLRKLDDQIHIRFVKRLVFFYKPTNDMFSRMELTNENARKLCDIGCHLIDFLIKSNQDEAQKHITDWLTDIAQCLGELSTQHSAPEAVLSLTSIHSTLSQYYFLFVGRFSLTPRGDRYLEKTGVYQNLLELVSPPTQELYIKLTISSLNYSRDGTARTILSKALTSAVEGARVYATKLLRVLLRTGVAGFSSWGIELLISQLYDQCQAVAMAAINILDEACDVQANLDSLVKLRPTLLHLGHRGVMVLCRFLSTHKGFKALMDANFVTNELQRWEKTYNLRYVKIVEEQLNEALTTYEKTYQGQFTRRSIQKRPKKDVFLPVHLYGQLCQHDDGLDLLRKEECVKEYIQHIHSLELLNDQDVLKLKIALWAVGHVGTSADGVTWLDEENVIPEIIRLAEECGVFSVRGTAFYVLGLFACTRKGTEILAQYGWESLCFVRGDKWPVTLEQGYFPQTLGEAGSVSNVSLLSAFKPEADRSQVSTNTQLSFIQEEGKGDISDQSFTCDKSDTQSVTNIPTSMEKLNGTNSNGHSLGSIPKSRTLPLESGDFSRYQSMPVRSLANGQPHPMVRVRAASDDGDVYVKANSSSMDSSVIETFSETFKEKAIIGDKLLTATTDSERLETASDPGLPDNCDEKAKEKEIVFKIGGSNILRDDRSSSESSHKSKSRTSSFNTDSTTSGVSSCDSGALMGGLGLTSLSPIASTSSLNTIASSQVAGQPDPKEPVHPSSVQRRLAKLTRVPSLRRRSAAPALGIYPASHSTDPSTFTSHRDAVGYATLRIIKRKRTYSSEGESDPGPGVPAFGDGLINRTYSTESDSSVDSSIWLSSIRRNISSASLPDYEGQQSSPYNTLNKAIIHPHTSTSSFVGLCLPVDIYMVFEVIEGEDHRSSVSLHRRDSYIMDRVQERKLTYSVPPLKPDVDLEHSADVCIVCVTRESHKSISHDALSHDDIPSIDGDAEQKMDLAAGQSSQGLKTGRPRVESVNDTSSATPGSVTSTNSTDSASKKLSEESPKGRNLIRKEIMRLVINLGSSVGAKGTEQGLLSLKQKFPKAFCDMCFYSEVCHLLATYSFRLAPRRFIQELFDELDVTKLLEEPRVLLDITEPEEDDGYKRMTPIHQGSLDTFPESTA